MPQWGRLKEGFSQVHGRFLFHFFPLLFPCFGSTTCGFVALSQKDRHRTCHSGQQLRLKPAVCSLAGATSMHGCYFLYPLNHRGGMVGILKIALMPRTVNRLDGDENDPHKGRIKAFYSGGSPQTYYIAVYATVNGKKNVVLPVRRTLNLK
ncbi:hypothetical protein CEXT_708221 [Caerostris extrusa]|uniref:Uncharacterized protein n=1 Tax=Caerostris extrusa TaxID=172846 RepID=A0AAV4Q485_CAEEX|nr:hypothetical protein CEXT_708221 [Caerostris extrusa]